MIRKLSNQQKVTYFRGFQSKNTIELLNVNFQKLLQNMKAGSEPDFGFINTLTFNDKAIGWHLFIDIIRNYPKF